MRSGSNLIVILLLACGCAKRVPPASHRAASPSSAEVHARQQRDEKIRHQPVIAAPPTAARAPDPRQAEAQQGVARTPPPGYRQLVDEAVREHLAKNYEESRALYHRAHALYPTARTLRGLGMVEFELRNYGECIKQLTDALASRVSPLEGDLRRSTEQLLARAEGFVARIVLESQPQPRRVLVDDVPVDISAHGPLLLRMGTHTIEVQAPGYAPARRVVQIRGGERQSLMIVLKPDTSASLPQ